MTYDELVAAVKEYLQTDEATFNANIDLFIKLTEETVYRAVQVPAISKSTTLATVSGTATLAIPADYLSVYSMTAVSGGVYYPMILREVPFLREVYPANSATAMPRYFAVADDDTFILGPVPDAIYSIVLDYHCKPASLVDGAGGGETWLSTKAENAMLFGTVLNGYIFLKGDQDVIAMYKESFERSVADLKIVYEGRNKKDVFKKADGRLET